MRKNKLTEAMLECYQLMFEQSVPPGDFKSMMDNAEINEYGQKVIDFMSYEITEEDFYRIIQEVATKYKFKNFIKRSFESSIALGCSPKFKKNFNEK